MAALLYAVVLESAASGRAGFACPEGDIASDITSRHATIMPSDRELASRDQPAASHTTCTHRDVISHAISPPGTH